MSNVLNKFRKHGKQKSASPKSRAAARVIAEEGGWRKDEHDVYWWLNAEQLVQLRALNDLCSDDASGDQQFWELFKDFRKKEHITRSVGGRIDAAHDTGKWWGSIDPEYQPKKSKQYSWDDPLANKKKGSLSTWWTGYKPQTWVSGDKAAKVALAMSAVEDTVGIIDDSGTHCSVVPHVSADRSVSFTDLKANRITISARPILSGSLDEGEAMDIMTGFGLHEASHSKKEGTRKFIGQFERGASLLQPMAVAAHLFNIIEDNRIEKSTKQEFPGFAGYFDKCLAYVWNECKPPKAYTKDLTDRLNAVVAFLRWPAESAKVMTHKSFEPERKWWTEWEAQYDPAKNLIPHIKKALDHLREDSVDLDKKGQDKGAGAQMDAQIEHEKHMRALGEALDEIVRQWREAMGGDLMNPCTHQDPKPGEGVDATTAREIQTLRDEQLTREKTPIKTDDGRGNPTLMITKPTETQDSKRMYPSKPDPMLAKYKAALLFRDDVPVDSIKLSREGSVDDDELWRWAADDWRVFQEKEEKRRTNARVYLLIDMSGSMSGDKLTVATRMTKLFVDSLTSMEGVTPKVYGHTGDVRRSGGAGVASIFRIWEPGDPRTRIGLLQTQERGNNYDGHALAWVAKQMIDESQGDDEQKIIIVLSDGIPAGTGYGDEQGMAHVRKVVTDAKRKGIRTLQMAIDPEMDMVRQKKMYDEFIPYAPGTSMDTVPRKLTNWLAKVL